MCPCGSGVDFKDCCEPLLDGAPAPSPERLMRSRFVAYAQKKVDYIVATTDPQRRGEVSREAVEAWMNEAEFTRLEVLSQTDEGNKGTVEFRAHHLSGGAEQIHHEVSRFRKQAGVWYFRTGKVLST